MTLIVDPLFSKMIKNEKLKGKRKTLIKMTKRKNEDKKRKQIKKVKNVIFTLKIDEKIITQIRKKKLIKHFKNGNFEKWRHFSTFFAKEPKIGMKGEKRRQLVH